MIATLPDGTERHVMIGQALAGQRFVAVKVTPQDTFHPCFIEWFIDTVMPTIVPK